MIRTTNRLAVGIALALVAAWGLLATNTTVLAQEPSDARLSFEDPLLTGDGISISVRMTAIDGAPMARQPIEFFIVPNFFGERPVALQTGLTNADGRATINYVPTWNGTHKVSALFKGDAAHQPSEAIVAIIVSGLPGVDISEPVPLESVHKWAAPAAAAVTIAVWLVFAAVLGRIVWGIPRAGHRGEVRAPSSPRRPVRRLHGGTHH